MLNQILKSSRDETKLSLTVKGVILGLVPVFIAISRSTGLEGVDETAVTEIIDLIASLVQQLLVTASLFMTTWGAVRKLFPPVYE